MKIKNLSIIFGLLAITIVASALGVISTKQKQVILVPKPIYYTDTVRIDTFSEANLNMLMQNIEMLHPEVVIAQAKLETGNFKSYLFKKSNNLFGFKNYNGYKVYKSWVHSVYGYKEWQDKKYKGGDYYKFLVYIKYAEDSNYIYKLKQFK